MKYTRSISFSQVTMEMMGKGNRTTSPRMYCWLVEPRLLVFCNLLGGLKASHCSITAKLQRKQGKGITFIVPVPKQRYFSLLNKNVIRLNIQLQGYSTQATSLGPKCDTPPTPHSRVSAIKYQNA